MDARNSESKKRAEASRPKNFARPSFLEVFSHVTHDGLREGRTTRSPKYKVTTWDLPPFFAEQRDTNKSRNVPINIHLLPKAPTRQTKIENIQEY